MVKQQQTNQEDAHIPQEAKDGLSSLLGEYIVSFPNQLQMWGE